MRSGTPLLTCNAPGRSHIVGAAAGLGKESAPGAGEIWGEAPDAVRHRPAGGREGGVDGAMERVKIRRGGAGKHSSFFVTGQPIIADQRWSAAIYMQFWFGPAVATHPVSLCPAPFVPSCAQVEAEVRRQ